MVTRKHTKPAKKRAPQQSATLAKNPPLTMEQKAAKFDELMASYDEAVKGGDAAKRAAEERSAARTAPVVLTRERMDRVQSAISEMNLACAAIARVAFDAGGHACGPVEWYLTAIENVAKTCCMRADVVRGLLDDHGTAHFGNFNEDFIVEDAVSEARRADRATEQEGADHD